MQMLENDMKKKKKSAMFYMQPSNVNSVFPQVVSEVPFSNELAGRTLLQAPQADVKPPISFNTSTGPCIMLWAQNLFVSLAPSSWVDLGTQTPSLSGSVCDGASSRWVAMLDMLNGFD